MLKKNARALMAVFLKEYNKKRFFGWGKDFARYEREIMPFQRALRARLPIADKSRSGALNATEALFIYALIRKLRPLNCIETGICNGLSSAIILKALKENGQGTLHSFELPASDPGFGDHQRRKCKIIQANKAAGWLVPSELHDNWIIHWGDSKEELKKLKGEYGFFLHDSLHTAEHVRAELNAVWDKLVPGALILVDDIDWHSGFQDYCAEKQLSPMRLSHVLGLTFKPKN